MNFGYKSRGFLLAVLAVIAVGHAQAPSAAKQSPTAARGDQSVGSLIKEYRHVEVASISDAIEQLTGRRMYMTHKMQAIFPTHFVGVALTVLLKKSEQKNPSALDGMLAAIDAGQADSVWVMKIEDGADIAGMGGLMGVAMNARGYAGAVIDGGVRDVAQLKKIGFPVYSTGAVPSTSVHHYVFAGSDIPVNCDGVQVNGGDIIAADQDGVVVVPRAIAAAVLARAQQLDFQEHMMYGYIEQSKSIEAAVKKTGRL
ncbi:RraA family protein [Acidipila rosea]|uniref:Regulator of RNase E activity RraA n=1 Tax=Acidipila rosea TaxID=768535 RepID=A0A4R1L3X5_9BACT|nr:RraA family protein [Acidipila rosea]TCK72714.1 regulator of RNase E activity RraA [Acidipila rosea]